MTKKKLILASSSPRRRQILENIGLEFEIIPSDYEEVFENYEFSYEKIEELAYNKAKAVLNKTSFPFPLSSSLILSADTVVVLNDRILGKPKNKEDAVDMLNALSGERHSIVTSICVIDSETLDKKISSTTSYVEFNKLSDNMILDYIEKYKPFDKAGSYGIQELPDDFVSKIDGSLENIIGLCPKAVKNILFKIGT